MDVETIAGYRIIKDRPLRRAVDMAVTESLPFCSECPRENMKADLHIKAIQAYHEDPASRMIGEVTARRDDEVMSIVLRSGLQVNKADMVVDHQSMEQGGPLMKVDFLIMAAKRVSFRETSNQLSILGSASND